MYIGLKRAGAWEWLHITRWVLALKGKDHRFTKGRDNGERPGTPGREKNIRKGMNKETEECSDHRST